MGNRNLSHGPAAAFAVVALWATVSVDLAASASISPASAGEPRGSALLARAATETPPIFSGTATFLELTTPQAASARPLKASDIVHGSISYDGGEEDRWIVTNPYLPGDRNFLSMINGPARGVSLRRPGGLCVSADGTVFVAPAAPRSSPLRKVDGKTRAVSTWLY